MAPTSARAAASNSLHPSVPASVAVRERRSLAPGRDGGSPSSLITVASSTSSPEEMRRASSSSTLGTDAATHQDRNQDRARARDLIVGGGITRGQTEAAQRLVQTEAHREQRV